jgi:hypothetical protein
LCLPSEIDPGEIDPGEIDPGEIDPGESAQYAQSVLIAHFVHTFWDITHFIHTQSYCIRTLCELQCTSCEIDPGEIGPGEIGPGEIGPGESAQYAQSVLIAHFVHTFLEYNTLYILYTYFVCISWVRSVWIKCTE